MRWGEREDDECERFESYIWNLGFGSENLNDLNAGDGVKRYKTTRVSQAAAENWENFWL